jgi:hypothetical protein
MTSEPLRQPDDSTADPAAGSASTSEPTAEDDTLTPAAAASAEAAAAAEAKSPTDTVTTAEAVAATEAAATDAAPVETRPRRRTAVLAGLRQLAIVVVGLAFFAGGVALGNYTFQQTRTTTAAVGAGDTPLGEPATVTREFIAALAANDADAIRSSLAKDPHIDLTREMERYGIQHVDKVEILGTQVDGSRSATEILMQYETTDGVPFAINLVVLVDGAQIEGFR